MITTDQTSFRDAFPVDLSLTNAEGEAAIRILDDASTGETLRVLLENGADRAFWLQAPASPLPRPSNYHIELRFRPGVLDLGRLGETRLRHTDAADLDGARWDLSHQRNDDGTVSFFLLRDRAVHVAPHERIHLVLENIVAAADAVGGSTLVEAVVRGRPGQVRRYLAGDVHRVGRIGLLRRRGEPVLPLEPAWVGTDTVLNDGESQNHLVLDLVNVGTRPILLDAEGLDHFSTLVLSDAATHDGDPRRLADARALAAMEVEVAAPGWVVDLDEEGPRPIWSLRPLRPTSLPPGAALRLHLANLVCDATSGPALLTIDHRNVPGYWDGRRTVTLRKAPLLFRRAADETGQPRDRVGIHTVHPTLDLSIGHHGTGLQADPDGGLALATDGQPRLRITPTGRTRALAGLDVEAGMDVAPTGGPADIVFAGSDSGISGTEDGDVALRTLGHDRLIVYSTGHVHVPGRPNGIDLSMGVTTSGIDGADDGSLTLSTANTPRITLDRWGSIKLESDVVRTDGVEILSRGQQLVFTTPDRWDLRWSVGVDPGDGDLQVLLGRSGRSDTPRLFSVDALGDVTAGRNLIAQGLRMGDVLLNTSELATLKALVDGRLAVELDLRLTVPPFFTGGAVRVTQQLPLDLRPRS